MSTMRERLAHWAALLRFRTSGDYWQKRYRLGGGSGDGSRGDEAHHKAVVINGFVLEHDIRDVIEFGCGDGVQLGMCNYPRYIGVDVSQAAVERCRALYREDASKRFITLREYAGEAADLALSLDVTYHLVEDEIYAVHLDTLAKAARRYVLLYTTSVDHAVPSLAHVRHRPVCADFERMHPEFERMKAWESGVNDAVPKHPLQARFFAYARKG